MSYISNVYSKHVHMFCLLFAICLFFNVLKLEFLCKYVDLLDCLISESKNLIQSTVCVEDISSSPKKTWLDHLAATSLCQCLQIFSLVDQFLKRNSLIFYREMGVVVSWLLVTQGFDGFHNRRTSLCLPQIFTLSPLLLGFRATLPSVELFGILSRILLIYAQNIKKYLPDPWGSRRVLALKIVILSSHLQALVFPPSLNS